jgi:hypothetical protein
MMSALRVYASDHPLLELALERLIEDDESDRDATFELLDAIDDLARDWLVPLGIAAQIECFDMAAFEGKQAAVPHHFLRASALHGDLYIDVGYTAARETTALALDGVTRRNWIAAALAQTCEEGREIALAELTWTIVRAKLPARAELYYPGGEVTSIVEEHDGAVWALGRRAQSPVGPPARVRAVNTHGGLELRLAVYWDAWTQQRDGRAMLDRGVQRVLARGRGWAHRQVFPLV